MNDINHFIELSKINVDDKLKKKQGLDYLSWSYALGELLKKDPTANWEMHPPQNYANNTVMVSCTVTAFGKPVYMWLPVMIGNKAIQNPDAVAVNKAMMRCLVKAIAAHGLGLYVYSGEDLPSDDDYTPQQQIQQTPVAQLAQQQGATMGKAKETLSQERFNGALQAIKNGGFTKERLQKDYALTIEQQAELASMVV